MGPRRVNNPRCPARYYTGWRVLRCSLAAGHPGNHEAYFADQPGAAIVAAYKAARIALQPGPAPAPLPPDPEPPTRKEPRRDPTYEAKKSHHELHPGAWMPQALHPPEIDDPCPDPPVEFAWEDMLPWEREANRKRKENP